MDSDLKLEDLPAVLEAILIVSPTRVSVEGLAAATGVPPSEVTRSLKALQRQYEGEDGAPRRGFELREVDGSWRFYSRSEWAPWVGKFITGDHLASLSQAALETLAVISYRQPITRAQISQIRGVGADGVVRTLLARGLIEEEGQTEAGAGLLRTTRLFLEKMGLQSVSDLPPLAPLMASADEADALASELE